MRTITINEAIEEAVRHGLGIAFLSCHGLRAADGGEGLCALQVEGLPVMQQWFIAHAKARSLSRIAAAFLDYVRANAAAEAFDPKGASDEPPPQHATVEQPPIAVSGEALPRER